MSEVDFAADVVIVDSEVHVATMHIEPHQTLIMRPGAEIVIYDFKPTDAALANTGIHVYGKWRTEGDGNMVIRSANPMGWRGHVHCGPGCDVDISGIEFRDLGRTDKSIPIAKVTNVPGRYALHFHRAGFDKKQFVRNCRVVRSKSWGFVNHSSIVDFIDCAVEDAFGAAFVAEAGNAQGGFYGCTAIRVDGLPYRGILNAQGKYVGNKIDEIANMQLTGDVARNGHGFWSDAPGIAIEDCQVFEARSQAYFEFAMPYPEFDTRRPPVTGDFVLKQKLGTREGNMASGSGGVDLWSVVHPENVIDGMTCIDCTSEAVTGRFTANLTHQNLTAIGRPGVANVGVNLAGPYGRNSRLENVRIENWKHGVILPAVGVSGIDGAEFKNNEVDILIDRAQEVNTLEFRNVGSPKIRMRDYLAYLQRFHEVYTASQRLFLTEGEIEYVMFWKEQHPDFVLWGSKWPAIVAGKTNQQIFDEFGVAPSGCLAPMDAEDMGTYLRAPRSQVNFVELPVRSLVNQNGFFGGNAPVGMKQLQFNFAGADRIVSVEVIAGWQSIPIEFDGLRTSVFIRGI